MVIPLRKFFSLAFLILACSLFVTCSGNKDPMATTPIATITVEPNDLGYEEVWYVAWDDDGTLLDYKKLTGGQPVTLSTTEPVTNNKFTLGYFRYRQSTTTTQTYITIFTDFTPGQQIDQKAFNRTVSTNGSFQFTMLDPPENSFINISSKYGNDNNSGTNSGGDETYTCDLMNDATKYIVNFYGYPGLYQLIDNPKNGDALSINFNDFIPYETPVTFNLPSSYINLSVNFNGFEAGQSFIDFGYTLDNSYYPGVGPSTYTSGYFPGITKFLTSLYLDYDDAHVIYTKYGDLPGDISWPDPSKYSVDSPDPNAFSVSVGEQVEYVQATWTNNLLGSYTNLALSSPKLAPRIGIVPPEMIAAHPEYAIKKELFTSWTIGFVTKGSQSYADNVSMYFSSALPEYEQTTVQISGN